MKFKIWISIISPSLNIAKYIMLYCSIFDYKNREMLDINIFFSYLAYMFLQLIIRFVNLYNVSGELHKSNGWFIKFIREYR